MTNVKVHLVQLECVCKHQPAMASQRSISNRSSRAQIHFSSSMLCHGQPRQWPEKLSTHAVRTHYIKTMPDDLQDPAKHWRFLRSSKAVNIANGKVLRVHLACAVQPSFWFSRFSDCRKLPNWAVPSPTLPATFSHHCAIQLPYLKVPWH